MSCKLDCGTNTSRLLSFLNRCTLGTPLLGSSRNATSYPLSRFSRAQNHAVFVDRVVCIFLLVGNARDNEENLLKIRNDKKIGIPNPNKKALLGIEPRLEESEPSVITNYTTGPLAMHDLAQKELIKK